MSLITLKCQCNLLFGQHWEGAPALLHTNWLILGRWPQLPEFVSWATQGTNGGPWQGLWESNDITDVKCPVPCLVQKCEMLVAQSYPTLCDPIDCSLPGSSVHGILQARILDWVAIPFSRGSFWLRDRTYVSCIAGRFFTISATRNLARIALALVNTKICFP